MTVEKLKMHSPDLTARNIDKIAELFPSVLTETLDADGNIWIANPLAPECALIAPGGAVLEVIDTGQPCYACMLGGDDGRTLFMLTAQTSVAHEAAAAPQGLLLAAEVDSPRAGRP